MSGVVATETVRPSHNSAFSAVVRKRFSFSVDSILASSPPKDAPKDTAADALHPPQTSPEEPLSPAEDRLSAKPLDDDDDNEGDEGDITVDSEPDDAPCRSDARLAQHLEEAAHKTPPPLASLLVHTGGVGPPLPPPSYLRRLHQPGEPARGLASEPPPPPPAGPPRPHQVSGAAQVPGARQSDPSEAQAQQQAAHALHHAAAAVAREEVPREAVPEHRRARRVLRLAQPDGDAGQDLVPEPPRQGQAPQGGRAGEAALQFAAAPAAHAPPAARVFAAALPPAAGAGAPAQLPPSLRHIHGQDPRPPQPFSVPSSAAGGTAGAPCLQ
ncbi:tropomyosin-1, isoforms 33/34-like [Penaeus chinensis]|uniref:tropomyosin-1, isoforms 33/34-like n=1 Tax=Penaeus chinensis TaxID=139456 RepID=UPI001FB6C044|nr:tropomyosin-1, isoforms 33/34-like [Penaeus chinensis]